MSQSRRKRSAVPSRENDSAGEHAGRRHGAARYSRFLFPGAYHLAVFAAQTETTQEHSLDYRPDIDGLRAIAVLGVIAFHFFPTRVRGGALGVDIFFVISGYLISSIILRWRQDGRFSFLQFYARRIKRTFPRSSSFSRAAWWPDG